MPLISSKHAIHYFWITCSCPFLCSFLYSTTIWCSIKQMNICIVVCKTRSQNISLIRPTWLRPQWTSWENHKRVWQLLTRKDNVFFYKLCNRFQLSLSLSLFLHSVKHNLNTQFYFCVCVPIMLLQVTKRTPLFAMLYIGWCTLNQMRDIIGT